ncbi:MAG: hypothetical protein ACT4PP_10800 [Sporichthyaceae bacterium]
MSIPTRKATLTYSVAAAATIALAGVPTALAHEAAPAKATTCKVDARLAVLPGIGIEPGAASYYSKRGGTVICDGKVKGQTVTGPGVYRSSGRFGTEDPDSCATGGEGWGDFQIVFPTSAGKVELRSAFTFVYGAIKSDSPITGTVEGDFFEGKFTLLPVKGDCVTAPITLSRVTGTITLHGFKAPK